MEHDGEATDSISIVALREMSVRGIAPTPRNYTVWYRYAKGTDSRLAEAVNLVVHQGATFTDQLIETLFEAFCVDEQIRPILARKADALSATAGEFLASLDAVGSNVASYDQAIGAFQAKVSEADTDIGTHVATLFVESRRVRLENARLQGELVKAATQIVSVKRTLGDVVRDTRTDSLTGIGNRRAFDESLNAAMREASETGVPFALVIADIDHFKRFNDVHGHPFGDEVLKLVSRTVSENIKGRDTAARHGGEEFSIVLPATTLKNAKTIAEQVRVAIASKRIVRRNTGQEFGGVTLSFGVAEGAPGESTESLIARADAALYEAKRSGRNRVCIAGPRMARQADLCILVEAPALT